MVTAQVLRGTELFAGLSDAQLQAIVELCREESREPGETIFVEGAEAKAVYLLLEGMVILRIQAGEREVMVRAIGNQGEVFGWSALVVPPRYTATAKCLEKSRVIAVDGSGLAALLDKDYSIGYPVMKRLAGIVTSRLKDTRSQLTSFLGRAIVTHG
ncbi:MAG: cyclic nucleotide-binding domain-containing protein [Chloroflexota bacterium]